jgi:hypothetical protein
MSENDVLDAEYRAFVRQLHEQTIGIVAEVDRYWMREPFREVTSFAAGVFEREYDEAEEKGVWDRCMGACARLRWMCRSPREEDAKRSDARPANPRNIRGDHAVVPESFTGR